jgi:hypothetical protein
MEPGDAPLATPLDDAYRLVSVLSVCACGGDSDGLDGNMVWYGHGCFAFRSSHATSIHWLGKEERD